MRRSGVAALGAVLLAVAGPVLALINPRFTPVDLVREATLIVELTPSPPDGKGVLTATVVKSLKGQCPVAKLTIELQPEWAKPLAESMVSTGDGVALLFIGKGEEKQDITFLHLAGHWIRLEAKSESSFAMTAKDVEMRGVWAGGSDMLKEAVEYILSTPDALVPVAAGCEWAERPVLGKIAGPVNLAQAVDLTGRGEIALFVAADEGDRVYRYDPAGKGFTDATKALKLASKSRLALWADFTGDGRCDLINWDGKALALWAQAADGTFPVAGVPIAADMKGGCLGLSALDAGADGVPGVLVTTTGGPVLLVPKTDGTFNGAALNVGKAERSKLGAPGACLVADFDGDGIADVLEPFGDASVFYKGQGRGLFAPAVRCGVGAGKGAFISWMGDFDSDGRMDLFMSSEDGCRVWHNRGGLKFQESFVVSGEVTYMLQPKAVCGQTCDINNDGRPDILVGYGQGIPMIFFNRGFRSFGKALQLTEDNVIPEATAGVQAAVVEDFNGDGGQDMAIVLVTGEVLMFIRSADDPGKCAGVRVSLPMGKGFAGPLAVTGWADKRCLGAWNVTAGAPGPLIGSGEAGSIEVRWQYPAGKARQTKLVVEDRPIRFVVPAEVR